MPAKKPADKLQRRNKPKTPDTHLVAMATAEPPDPPKVSKKLKDQWTALWSSALAVHWNQDSDLFALRQLFELYDEYEKYRREAKRDGSVSKGSTGQKTLHPLL